MIFASVDKIVAYVQENMFALREVISGLSLGPVQAVYFRPDLLRQDHLGRRFGSNPKR